MSTTIATKEWYINKAIKKHGKKFDYSKIIYTGLRNKMIFTCPIHGTFEMTGYAHLSGVGCSLCSRDKQKSTTTLSNEKYIAGCKKTHGDKFDYTNTNYKGDKEKIEVKCNICSTIFYPPAGLHKRGSGCPECALEKNRMGMPKFYVLAKEIHGEKYDYSLVNFKITNDYISIICKEHGIFEQTVAAHIYAKNGCPKCANYEGGRKNAMALEEFIRRAIEIHGDKYDYSLVEYINSETKVKIICPIHGVFEQTPSSHINNGYGCNACGYISSFEKLTNTKEIFVENAIIIHGDKFIYDDVDYKTNKVPVWVICKKHGKFRVRPDNHLAGAGCPVCNESKGENKVASFLDKLGIFYIREYKIEGYKYRYDFYIPNLNILIEYDGQLHFIAVRFFGGEKALRKQKRRDKIKNSLAKDRNISLIRIPYTKLYSLEMYLSKQLSLRFNYRVNGVFYKNIITLCKELSLSPNTSSKDLYEYNTYDQLMSMFKE